MMETVNTYTVFSLSLHPLNSLSLSLSLSLPLPYPTNTIHTIKQYKCITRIKLCIKTKMQNLTYTFFHVYYRCILTDL